MAANPERWGRIVESLHGWRVLPRMEGAMHATGRNELAWTDIEPYFDRALQLDEQSCATWLGELADSQPNLAPAVRALLEQRAALNAAGFLEGAAFAGAENLAPAPRDVIARHAARLTGTGSGKSRHGWTEGADVGPYRLIREIRVGGTQLIESCVGERVRPGRHQPPSHATGECPSG